MLEDLFDHLLGFVWELSDGFGLRDAVNPLGLAMMEVTNLDKIR